MESAWTFLLDENVGRSVAGALARRGYATERGVEIFGLSVGESTAPTQAPRHSA